MTSQAFERVRAALEEGGADFSDNRQNHFKATCPAHEDRTPSLGVADKGDKVLLHCYSGCQNDEVVKALGIQFDDLFDGELAPVGKTRATLVRSYLYERENGEPFFWVDRYFPKTFRQRLPGVDPVPDLSDKDAARHLGLRDQVRQPIPYHLPHLLRALEKQPRWVWWVDGEKDVETAEREGLLATCPPGFRKWDPSYAEMLRGAAGIILVVDQDKEKPDGTLGAGQQAAIQARKGFRSVGLDVKVAAPAAGKDLTDHFQGGFGVKDFVPDKTVNTRPRGLTADVLLEHDFGEVNWVVQGVLPEGLTVFAGKSKAGKSWTALDLCMAVASGGPALSHLATSAGSAIYLAREDTYRRLRARMAVFLAPGEKPPAALELVPSEQDWQGGEYGLANLTEWAEEVTNPRLVVIDTLAKLEPEMGATSRSNVYAGEYAMMARYKQWADRHHCAVVLVHHDSKAQGKTDKEGWLDDPFDQVSGSRGIIGAADTLWFLETHRFRRDGRLNITGRDVVAQSLELRRVGPVWTCIETPEEGQ